MTQPTLIYGPHMGYTRAAWVPCGHGLKMGNLCGSHVFFTMWVPYRFEHMGPSWDLCGLRLKMGNLCRSHVCFTMWVPYRFEHMGPSWDLCGQNDFTLKIHLYTFKLLVNSHFLNKEYNCLIFYGSDQNNSFF